MERVGKRSRWVCCPICNGRTRIRIYPDTVMFKFPLYCPKCKKETKIDVIDVMNMKMAFTR